MADQFGHERPVDVYGSHGDLLVAAMGALPGPGGSTPMSDSAMHLLGRSRGPSTPQGGGPYMGAMAVAKAAQETAILTAMKRQLEALEEKLGGQILRVQQQGDRLRDSAMSRVDAKVGIMEALQPKLDRRIAELGGNYKGLSDEMQAQIRRIDQMDTRFWDWRHQLEEEVRAKFLEVEQVQKQADSAARLASATNEDSAKRISSRLKRLETLVEERLGYYDEVTQNVHSLDARIQAIEAQRIQDIALCNAEGITPNSLLLADMPGPGAEGLVNGASLAAFESKLVDSLVKIDHGATELEEMQARVEAQEERLRSFRTLMDTKEETYRINKFDRQDWENRAKELHQLTQELDKYRIMHSEQIEVFKQKFEHHDKAHDEMCVLVRKLQDRPVSTVMMGATMEEPIEYVGDGTDTSAYEVEMLAPDDWAGRMDAAEERLDALYIELQTVRTDAELAPRVAALVDSLRQVAPKVMANEKSVQQFGEKLRQVEAQVAAAADDSARARDAVTARVGQLEAELAAADGSGRAQDAVAARVGQLEAEVGRLRLELEGAEVPEAAVQGPPRDPQHDIEEAPLLRRAR